MNESTAMYFHEAINVSNYIWIDYLLFSLILVISAGIGFYFSTYGKKGNSLKEYLHGGKTMGIIPISVSLVATHVSGITVLGNPSEVYMFGTLLWLNCIGTIFASIITDKFFLPVFYELQLNSTFEYLQLRFDRSVRTMCSLMSTLSFMLHLPIVVYGPAIVISQVTGLNLHYIIPSISVVCILYTMLGGIKAVVWTDLLQGSVVIITGIVIAVVGINHVGGIETVWQRSMEGGRIRIFEMNPSPFKRLTFWSVIIGTCFAQTGLLTNQATVQRFVSVPTLPKARCTVYWYAFGISVIYTLTTLIGLTIYAEYHDCDPIMTKAITKPDGIMTYYITNIMRNVPGISGLFIGAIMCAALSTMSSFLNSLGTTIFEDYMRPLFRHGISDQKSNNIIKLLIVIIGIISIGMVFVVERLGLIMQLTASLHGICGGATLGMYVFGMFYPRANVKGALAGGISCVVIMAWLVTMAQLHVKYPSLPRSAVACGYNETLPQDTKSNNMEDVFILYKLSFTYYSFVGLIILLLVGISVSHVTAPPKSGQCNPTLFTPLIRKYMNIRNNNNYDICQQTDHELPNCKA